MSAESQDKEVPVVFACRHTLRIWLIGERNVFLSFSVENEFERNFILFAGSNYAEMERKSRNRNSIPKADNVNHNEMKVCFSVTICRKRGRFQSLKK